MSTTTAVSPEVLAKYQPVIGLEVHVQLLTETKAFCGCVNRYGGEPNTHVCPTCLGLPGALPVLNRRAVELAVLAAKAIHCEIRETSIFSRKNYFYPDSPKGYQISQFDRPMAEHGGSNCARCRRRAPSASVSHGCTGGGRGQESARWLRRLRLAHLHRPEPMRHAAGGDRQRAGYAHAR